MKRQTSFLLPLQQTCLIVLWVVLTGCTGSTFAPSPQPRVTLAVSGSGTVISVLETLKPTIETDVPTIQLNLLTGTGTSGGVQGVMDGSLQVAAMARAPNEEELAQGIQYVPVGDAAVAIITHPDNSVTSLTPDQIFDIFTGKITNWSEVGGADMPIVAFIRDEDESATIALRDTIFGDAEFAPSTTLMTSAGDMITSVSGTPGSIGFGNWPGIRARNGNVNAIAIDGERPNQATYPVLTFLGLGFVETKRSEVQPLLDWFASESGRSALTNLDIILPTP